jgi:hypothetical protein
VRRDDNEVRFLGCRSGAAADEVRRCLVLQQEHYLSCEWSAMRSEEAGSKAGREGRRRRYESESETMTTAT